MVIVGVIKLMTDITSEGKNGATGFKAGKPSFTDFVIATSLLYTAIIEKEVNPIIVILIKIKIILRVQITVLSTAVRLLMSASTYSS